MYKIIFILSLFSTCLAFESGKEIQELAIEVLSLSPEKEKLYHQITDHLRCPTCNGMSVLQSDAPFSLQIKKTVLEQVKSNKSEKDVMAFFIERYGLWILREPPVEGFHMIAWMIPLSLVLLGIFSLWFFVWRKTRVTNTHGIRNSQEIFEEFARELEQARLRRRGS